MDHATWYYAGTGNGMNIDTITGRDTNIHASTRMYTSTWDRITGKHGISPLTLQASVLPLSITVLIQNIGNGIDSTTYII